MTKHGLSILISLLLAMATIACQPSQTADAGATAIPFPTVTPGAMLQGLVSTPARSSRTNLAAADVMIPQMTPTPDTGACPTLSNTASLPDDVPTSTRAITQGILEFLSSGGAAVTLEDTLRDNWQILGETGFVRSDIDLTGDDHPEVIVGYVVPDERGNLLIAGCEAGHYVLRHQITFTQSYPPQLILVGDTNHDGLNDLVFVEKNCDTDEECLYRTHIITWKPDLWRFVSLLGTTIESDSLPEIIDMDNDQVGEIVIRLERYGSLATGPLRTGVNIYDWDGSVYVLSIIQLDPPRYQIQIIHAADQQFAMGNIAEAVSLYQRALTDEALRVWRRNERPILEAYILYRMLVARTAAEDAEAEAVYQYTLDVFPISSEAPVYVTLTQAFWDAVQNGQTITEACRAVLTVIGENPEAVSLMNRYGNRNPTYTAQDLCPF